MKTFFIYFSILLSLFAGCGGAVILNYTKVSVWVPMTVALVAVCVLWPLLRKLWLRYGVWGGVALHTAVVGTVAFCGFLGINAAFPHPQHHSETGVVARKYTKDHERRGGRKGRRVLGHYTTFHVVVALPDSAEVEYQVNGDNYRRTRIGSEVEMDVTKGFFGYEIVKRSAL
ncbi:MAG: hypothetical protein K2F63_06300 [Muribaculaceae bacterium]|nr:hypothetical protein [Muribaculaceae bacterium]MDE6134049.1 hypothetical protein [Muribaculaceae bacterium]